MQSIKSDYDAKKCDQTFVKSKSEQPWALCRLSLLNNEIGRNLIEKHYNVLLQKDWSLECNFAFIEYLIEDEIVRKGKSVIVFFDVRSHTTTQGSLVHYNPAVHLTSVIASNLQPSNVDHDTCVLAMELYLLLEDNRIDCVVVDSGHEFLLKLKISRSSKETQSNSCKKQVMNAIHGTLACEKDQRGGNKLVKVLGKYRKVYVLKMGRTKKKFVTYMGKLTLLSVLQEKERALAY